MKRVRIPSGNLKFLAKTRYIIPSNIANQKNAIKMKNFLFLFNNISSPLNKLNKSFV